MSLTDNDEDWYRAHQRTQAELAAFDAVLMRKDPPFDLEYLTSIWLLSQAEREGARVFNNPAAVRDHNEKLGILEFPRFVAPTLASRDPALVHAFIDEQRDVAEREIALPAGVHVHWLTLVGLDRTIPHRGIAVLDDAREMLATAKVDTRVKVFRPITRKIRQTTVIT